MLYWFSIVWIWMRFSMLDIHHLPDLRTLHVAVHGLGGQLCELELTADWPLRYLGFCPWEEGSISHLDASNYISQLSKPNILVKPKQSCCTWLLWSFFLSPTLRFVNRFQPGEVELAWASFFNHSWCFVPKAYHNNLTFGFLQARYKTHQHKSNTLPKTIN